MQGNKPVKIDRYSYLSGRIRALEIQLLDSGRLSRLYEARSTDDVVRILAESGYPAAPDPETSLSREIVLTYDLLVSLFPDRQFMEVLLLFHDFHNLKVVLKSLIANWPRTSGNEDPAQQNDLPESSSLASYQAIEALMQRPSLVDPNVLFQAVRDRQPDQVQEWLYTPAVQAARRYQSTYDISDIDLTLDRAASQKAIDLAGTLNNQFFNQYLARRSDLINLGLLLRTRFLKSGEDYLKQALLPGGKIPAEQILACYNASVDQIRALYESTPYAGLAVMAETYGQQGTASRFSQLADNLVIDHLRTARWILRGPEIPLSYVIARELEIKNIRIVLTCLRNGLPAGQAREMARDSYLTWR